jgi:hypothetical protein
MNIYQKLSAYVLLSATLLSLSACRKDKEPDNKLDNTTARRVVLVNEGGFQFGNSSLSVYLPDSMQVFNDLFQSANNSALGDVAQSAIYRDSLLYVVVNNSTKVEVLNRTTFERKATINIPGSSPRYIHFISNEKAYLTELYADKIWIFNPTTNAVTSSIKVNGWTEEMVATGTDIYVAERTTLNGLYQANVLVINSASNQITKTISLVGEPNSIVKDNQNNVWVLCNSNTAKSKTAMLYKISPATQTITDSFAFASSASPSYLRVNKQANTLYYFTKGIYKMTTSDNALPSSAFISTGGKTVYALNIDPSNDDVYISDALDYSQAASISRYDKNGNLIQNFTAGINTNQFVFE